MARLIDRSFNPNVPVYVRRFFVASGRHWNPGDLFDWQRLSVAQRRVKQLFDNGKLMHLDEMPASDLAGLQARESAGAAKVARAPAPAGEPEMPPNEPETVAASAEKYEIVDDLTDLDMKSLRAIAAEEDAPTRVSREAQREAIRENRREREAG